MSDLLAFLRSQDHQLNLSDISRRAGYSSSYLKHVVAGRRCFNRFARRKVRRVLDTLFKKYGEVSDVK